ncbi:MAG: hypothetical protein U5N27_17705 [Rhizobium sp.]|nr:hypothetical protein [Rhizobium sp.]
MAASSPATDLGRRTVPVSSPALFDDMLIMIARTQGADHAGAAVMREGLSPTGRSMG